MAIGDYVDKHNDNPKPFVWTAKASDVLEKVRLPAPPAILVHLHDAPH